MVLNMKYRTNGDKTIPIIEGIEQKITYNGLIHELSFTMFSRQPQSVSKMIDKAFRYKLRNVISKSIIMQNIIKNAKCPRISIYMEGSFKSRNKPKVGFYIADAFIRELKIYELIDKDQNIEIKVLLNSKLTRGDVNIEINGDRDE